MDLATNKISVLLGAQELQTSCGAGTPVGALIEAQEEKPPGEILGAVVNNDVVSLSYPLEVDSRVQFLTLSDSDGWRIYRKSLSFLMAKAVKETYPTARLYVEHTLGTAFYCNFEMPGQSDIQTDQREAIEARMRELVALALPIERRKIFFADALEHFERQNQWDKYNLLRFRNPPKIVVYQCGEFLDLAHGPLASNTSLLTCFKLIPYSPGFVIQFPDRSNPCELGPFEKQPHLFQIFKEHKEWGKIVGVQTVGDLNKIIAEGEFAGFVRIEEAFHEKKVARIADLISGQRDRVRWILAAGPSSAGKTTFAKRLQVQLRVNGLRPVMISVDDYFVNREDTPRDEFGNYDFENIETIDLELFHDHLVRLDRGEEVERPSFNFNRGAREYHGEKLRIEDDQMILVEGIHSLNPRLTEPLPPERKFKIYISALTQLNLDDNNRISTTDNRLLRRLVRDHQFRGNSALQTLTMWPSVRRGEKNWIFPFQQEADMAFNSALDYELAVLKPFAEHLLAEVKPYDEQYADARRLMEFLSSFVSAPSAAVPTTSILREFIGSSSFAY